MDVMGLFTGMKIMSLTDAAAARVAEIVAKADGAVVGVKVGVRNGGCAGMAYTVDLVREADAKDDVVEEKGVKVFVDPKATLFLLGATMDFKVTKVASTFTFDNPNQVDACGCGESVTLRPADPATVGG
jgi:iron-sulfur cluster assembly protein